MNPSDWEKELEEGDKEAYQEVCWRLDSARWSLVESGSFGDDELMAFDLAVAAFKEKHKALED